MRLKPTLLLALLLISGAALVISSYAGLPVDLMLLGVAVLVLGLYLAVRSPIWFLVAAMFMPQWKTYGIFLPLNKAGDLTLVVLLCLALGLAWRVLMWSGRVGHKEIGSLFSGNTRQFVAFGVFAGLVAASYFYTSAPDYGGAKLWRFLLIGTLLLVAPFFLILCEDDFRLFAKLFIGFSAVTSLQLVTNLETRSQDAAADITRIGAGWLMGMAILVLLFYPVIRTRKWQRVLMIFLLPVFIGGLMAAAARGPIVALCLSALLGMAVWIKQGRMKIATALFLLLFLTLGLGGAYFVLRQTDSGKYSAKANELEVLATGGSSTGSGGERVGYYRTTIAALPKQPLMGSGIGSWSTFYYGSDQRNYPHNLFLEIAFEEGFVGFAAFLALLLVVGTSIYRMIGDSQSHFLALGLLVLYCVIISLFSGDLDDNRLLWLWIGMALSVSRLVHMRVSAFRARRRNARQAPGGVAVPVNVPVYPAPAVSRRYSMRGKDRPWREKFVF